MRFLTTIVGALIAVLMALGTVYFWGIGQVHPKYDHPFFKSATPWLAVPVAWTLGAKPMKLPKNTIRWVDVHRNAAGVLIAAMADESRELVTLVQNTPGHERWILNILDNADSIDRQLAEVLKPWLDKQDFLIQSDIDVVLRSTKEELATVPYGSSQSDRMRFSSFLGMAPWPNGLVAATPFHGDVYISPLMWKKVRLVDPEVCEEIKRRQKSLIIGPLSTQAEWDLAQSRAPDGYYVVQPELLTAWETIAHPHP